MVSEPGRLACRGVARFPDCGSSHRRRRFKNRQRAIHATAGNPGPTSICVCGDCSHLPDAVDEVAAPPSRRIIAINAGDDDVI